METFHSAFFILALVAALAPVLAEIPIGWRTPVVAIELLLGILIGPHVLNWATPDGLVGLLGELGLTFLLFMVGLEMNMGEIRGKSLNLAVSGWLLSFLVAIISMYLLHEVGLIQAPPLLAGAALSTTALGVLVPLLRDEGILETPFGKLVVSAAAMGEFGPLMVVSVLLIPTHSTVIHTLFIVVFILLAFIAAYAAIKMRSSKWLDLLGHTLQSSGQLPVRLCIALQALLVLLAAKFGLNIVIGAFAAGMVVGLASQGEPGKILRQKLDAIGYGFLIPFFFIDTGMRFDVSALWTGPLMPVQLIALLALMVLVRGVPILLYGDALTKEERLPFSLYSATGLPLIAIIAQFGVSSGLMAADRAAVLLSAGMISVLVFPILASHLRRPKPS
jgi:Kef-type K+ transport system membrane component KefB